MANKIKIGLKVNDDGSLSEAEKQAAKVNKQLKGISENAPKASKALNSIKGDNMPMPAERAKKASMPTDDQLNYKVARGLGGSTGAEARDFAKQSQGLGGLVHVYATFAANLFAVSAAFTALRKAADVTNMIKGLDQLGASSGRNLGQLSKDLVRITEGAITLQEAMAATAQSTAAGMSGENLKRLAAGAKNVSAVMGIGLPDALSRLSRGISKIEPELLDELGIFVKVDSASKEYARSLGKSATALTDFEKRAGFAKAVLDQLDAKFNSINVAVNPYDKLASSIAMLTHSSLELINKVLGPLVKLLAESPTGLAVAMAAVGTVLLKMAMPAISDYKARLKKVAQAAMEHAEEVNNNYAEYQGLQSASLSTQLNKRIALEKEAMLKTAGYYNTAAKNKELGIPHLKAIDNIGPNTLEANEKLLKQIGTQIKTNTTLAEKTRDIDADAYKMRTNNLAYYEKQKAALTNIIALQQKELANQNNLGSTTIGDWKRQQIVDRARLTAAKSEVLSNVYANTQSMGASGAWATLQSELREKDIKGWKSWGTSVKGAAIIATSALDTALGALGPWLQLAALVATAATMAYGYFSKTAKEAAQTKEALESLNSAGENVARTLDVIASKPFGSAISIESINARANAFNELADATAMFVKRSLNELNKLEGISLAWDIFSKAWGGDVKSQLSKGLSNALVDAFKVAEKGGATDKAKETISKLLKIDVNSAESLRKSLASIPDAMLMEIPAAINELKKLGNELGNSAASGMALKTAWADSAKAFETFANSTMPTDNLTKVGLSMMDSAQRFTKELQEPTKALIAMETASNSIDVLKLFPPAAAQSMMKYGSELTTLKNSLEAATNVMDSAEEKTIALNKAREDMLIRGGKLEEGNLLYKELKAVTEQIDHLASVKAISISIVTDVKTKTSEIKSVFADAILSQFVSGANIVGARLGAEWAKAGATISTAIAGLLEGTEAGVRMRADADKSVISAQMEALKVQKEQIKQLALNTVELRIRNAQDTLNSDKSSEDSKKLAGTDLSKAQEEKLKLNTTTIGKGSVTKLANELKAGVAGVTQELVNYAISVESVLAQTAALGAQAAAIDIKKQADLINVSGAKEAERLANTKKLNAVQQQSLSIIEATGIILPALVTQKKIELENIALEITSKEELLAINQKIRLLDFAASKLGSGNSSAKDEIKAKRDKLDIEARSLVNNKLLKDLEVSKAKTEKAFTDEKIQREIQLETTKANAENTRITLRQEELTLLNSIGLVSDKNLQAAMAELAILQEKTRSAEATRKIEQDFATKKAAYGAALGASSGEAQAAILAQYNAELTAISALVSNEKLLSDAKLVTLKVTSDHNIELKTQSDLLADMTSTTKALADVFGDVGKAMGDAGEALLKLAITDVNYIKNKQLLESKLSDPNADNKDKKMYAKELADLDKRNTKDQLANMTAVAGNTKKMFGEKTAAYKAFHAVEMGLKIASLAMELKTTAMEISAWWTKVAAKASTETAQTGIASAGFFARLPLYVSEIYASTLGQLGPIAGPAVATALIAGLLSMVGGGGGVSLPSSAQQQEVQGTGQKYVGTELTTNGAGVYGDVNAKNSTIVDSIELIESHTFSTMEYSNGMLESLKEIRKNTTGLVSSIVRMPGLTSAAKEATSSGAGGLFSLIFGSSSSEVSGKGIQVAGAIRDILDGAAQIRTYKDVTTTDSGFLGLGGGTETNRTWSDLASDDVQESLSSIFRSYITALNKAGAELGIAGVEAMISGMSVSENFLVDTMGLTGSELAEAIMSQIGIEMDLASEMVFPNLTKFKTIGESFSETVIRLVSDGQDFAMSLESIGMSVSVIPETLATVSQASMDAVHRTQAALSAANAAAAVPVLTTFEGYEVDYMTGLKPGILLPDPRLIKAAEDAQAAYAAAVAEVTQASSLSTTKNIDLQQRLIEAAGGLDSFISKTEDFASNFLDESERLAPIQRRVVKALGDLGLSSIDTLGEFKDLVLGLDLTVPASEALYTSLMNIAGGFYEVYKSSEVVKEVLTAEEYRQAKLSQSIELLKLNGLNTEAQNRLREEEISIMDMRLRVGQREIWRLEDEIKLRTLSISILEAEGFAYKATVEKRITELSALTEAERPMQLRIWALQDETKTTALNTELLEAQGEVSQALYAKRMLELRSLSETDAAIKIRIWNLQDELKFNNALITQEAKIQTLLGNTAAALSISRNKELDTMEDALRPRQEYIYALEDEQALKDKLVASYTKESEAIKTTVSSTKALIETLKDYRNSLTVGAQSTLTPLETYNEAKKQLYEVAAIATSNAVTDAEIAARDAAVNKLPALTSTFLEASKVVFASSEQYTSDFQSVLNVLDSTTSSLSVQLSTAELQLEQLELSNSFLDSIAANTESTASLLAQYLVAISNTAAAAANASTTVEYTPPNYIDSATSTPAITQPSTTNADIINNTVLDKAELLRSYPNEADASVSTISRMYRDVLGREAEAEGLAYWDSSGYGAAQILEGILNSEEALGMGIRAFAKGGLASGVSLVGENGPEIVDFANPGRVYTAEQTLGMFNGERENVNSVMKALVSEVVQLKEELAQLRKDQNKQTGDLIASNYDANERAASSVVAATRQVPATIAWNDRAAPALR